MTKHYYVAQSYMGLNYTYDSPCWSLLAFQSRADRDAWAIKHECNDQGNRVTESVSAATARKIWPPIGRGDMTETGRLTIMLPCADCGAYDCGGEH